MKAIMAYNNLGYIGLKDGLPWKSKDDLQHFKRLTDGCNLLVGYRTYQTLPKLSNRNVYLDSNFSNVDELLSKIDWCIGGKKTYEKYCQYFTELHISIINNNTIGDVIVPDLKNLNTNCKIFRYFYE